jgi:hypothetical protein
LVGWKCGETLYEEFFGKRTADFNIAVNRQSRVKNKREVEELSQPLTAWLDKANASNVFEQYQDVRDQLKTRLRWIWTNARSVLDRRSMTGKLSGPQTFFSEERGPEEVVSKGTG